jgi:hypothetical protein
MNNDRHLAGSSNIPFVHLRAAWFTAKFRKAMSLVAGLSSFDEGDSGACVPWVRGTASDGLDLGIPMTFDPPGIRKQNGSQTAVSICALLSCWDIVLNCHSHLGMASYGSK